MGEKITAEDIRSALRKKYSDYRRFAIAEEVGLTTGFSHRRLDMMILDCYWSNGFRIDGFEIKISASDLRRELEDPEKHVAFFDVIDYYTLAVPAGVVDSLLDVIPPKWGILIVNKDGSTRYKKRPLALKDEKADRPVPRGFLASITRSIQERQPSSEELRREYERGLKDGEEKANRHRGYMEDRIKKEYEKLEAYDQIQLRFRLWGNNANEKMDAFEAFQKMDLSNVAANIRRAADALKSMQEFLKEVEK